MAITYVDSTDAGGEPPLSVSPPGSIQDNDILLCWSATDDGSISWPSGFSEITQLSAANAILGVAWKRCSSESGNYTVGGASWSDAMIVAYRGCVTGTPPIDTYCTGTYTTDNTTLEATPGVTLSETGALVFFGFSNAYGCGMNAVPSGFAVWSEDLSDAPWFFGLCHKLSQDTTPTGVIDATLDSNTSYKHAIVVGLLPDSSSATGSGTPTIPAITVNSAATATGGNAAGAGTATLQPLEVTAAGTATGNTFGDTTEEYSSRTMGAGYITLYQAVLPENGTVDSLWAYLDGLGNLGNQVIRALIYEDNGSDYPGDLVDEGTEVTVLQNAAVAWVELPFAYTLNLNGATYWIGFETGQTSSNIHYYRSATGASNLSLEAEGTYASPEDPFPADWATTDRDVSVYAFYTATNEVAGTGTPTLPALTVSAAATWTGGSMYGEGTPALPAITVSASATTDEQPAGWLAPTFWPLMGRLAGSTGTPPNPNAAGVADLAAFTVTAAATHDTPTDTEGVGTPSLPTFTVAAEATHDTPYEGGPDIFISVGTRDNTLTVRSRTTAITVGSRIKTVSVGGDHQ